MMSIEYILFVLIAVVTGCIARPVQGGQWLKGYPYYRVLVTFMYMMPLIGGATLLIFSNDNQYFYGVPIIDGESLLSVPAITGIVIRMVLICVAIGAFTRPHYGPNHGSQMDMGREGGTLKGDYLGMLVRFICWMPIGLAILVGFVDPSSAGVVKVGIAVALMLIGAMIPTNVYGLCWWLDMVYKEAAQPIPMTTIKHKIVRLIYTNKHGPTEVAERVYAGLYQGVVAGILVALYG